MFRAVFQGTIIRNEPAYRPRPVAMAGYHKFSHGDFDAFVMQSALEAIADQARRAAPNEMIGYLLGRPFRDAKGTYAVVTEALFAESACSGPATVETTLDDERDLLAKLLADHPLADRLGWFHSHPFFLPRYSETDLENQRFWSEPYQLGLLACLDRAESVSIFAFRGPQAQSLHPPYTTSLSPPDCVPTCQPIRLIENRQTTPRTPPRRRKHRRHRPSLLLTLAVGVVWPIAYLIGVRMIVQAMREGGRSAPRVIEVAKDGPGSLGKRTDAPSGAPSPGALKVATPAASVGQPPHKCP